MIYVYVLLSIYLGTLTILLGCHYAIYRGRVKLFYKLIDKVEEVRRNLGEF